MDNFNDFVTNNVIHRLNPSNQWYKWNANGTNFFYANVNRLVSDRRREAFMHYLNTVGINFDVLILVETFFKDEVNVLNLPGYKSYHSIRDKNESKRKGDGGGVSIYVANSIKSSKIFSSTRNGNEFLLIHLSILNLNVLGLYRPPDTSQSRFVEDLSDILESYQNIKTLLFGDINMNLLLDSSVSDAYTNMLASNGYVILNKLSGEFATRISNTISSVIDHVITNCLDTTHKLVLVDNSFSDHRHVFLNLVTSSYIAPQLKFVTKIFTNFERVKSESSVFLEGDLNISQFQSELQQSILRNTSKTVRRVKLITFKNPWFNESTRKSQKMRDAMYKKMKKYPNNLTYPILYMAAAKRHVDLITETKRNYYSRKLESSRDDQIHTWKLFNELMHGKKEYKASEMFLEVGDKTLSDNHEVAEKLNEHFSTIGEKLASSIPDVTRVVQKTPASTIILDDFIPTDVEEVEAIISCLNVNAAPGPDGISLKLLKSMGRPFSNYIAAEINKSFELGIFPDSLKIARIIPLFKGGGSHKPEDYRPISILSVLSKIYETVLKNRLEQHFQINTSVNENQFGFAKRSNTTAAAVNLMRVIYAKLNKHGHKTKVGAVFIDLQKAFDTVSHKIFLDKLCEAGVRGQFHKIISSFLTNRKQFVVVGDAESQTRELNYGIGQGTILGPLIFSIFINDLFNLKLNSFLQLYADDGVFVFEAPNHSELKAKMEEDMKMFSIWLDENKLSLNVGKTKYMIFKLSRLENNLDPTFNSFNVGHGVVHKVDNFEYLGLVIDSGLTFADHVAKVVKKIRPYVGILSRIKYYLSTKSLKMLYFAHIHSHIHYMLPLYGACRKSHLDELELMHKKSIKTVFKLSHLHPTADVYRKGIPDVHTLTKRETVLLIHKIKNNLLKNNYRLPQVHEKTGRTTRQSENIEVQRAHGHIKDTLFYDGINLYNTLPLSLKNEKSIAAFKLASLKFFENQD